MQGLRFNPNPIMVKEFRSRMRGWRAFAMLTVYLIFLALFSYAVYRLVLVSPPYSGGMPLSPFIGQALYVAIANLSLFFVAFLMPALTATAISSEHERLTLEMLQATPLAPHTILFGKLVSTTGYIILLLFAAIPMLSLVFIFGGVTLLDLFLAALIIWVTTITFGMIGLFFSAWRKRTIQAIVFSYLVILFFIIGTYMVYVFWGVISQDFPPRWILVVNPFSALASVLARTDNQGGVSTFFGLIAGWGPAMVGGDFSQLQSQRPLWHYTLTFEIGLSIVLYLLATRFIKPVRPWRIGWKGVSLVALIALLYLLANTTVFFTDIQQSIYGSPVTPTPTPVPMFAVPAVEPAVVPLSEPTATSTEEPDDD